jgi:hypothetical protein
MNCGEERCIQSIIKNDTSHSPYSFPSSLKRLKASKVCHQEANLIFHSLQEQGNLEEGEKADSFSPILSMQIWSNQ